ncbi:MAG: 4Fe-4S dicluster domain-containing protein [Desulfobacterales bacterium]|nr:4Fe-4S dicluster domain-containing protein [Desulfobacterales bacterium]
MKVVKIDKENWAEGIEKIKESYKVFGPSKSKEFHLFKELEKGEAPDLNFLNTRLSPKSMFFPQSEGILCYCLDPNKKDECNIVKEIQKDYSPKAIIGIRPCDAKAFTLVRPNFDNEEYQDPYWIKAYDSITFIGLACSNTDDSKKGMPCSSCFCTSAGCGPFNEEGLDALIVNTDDGYIIKALTNKGEEFLNKAELSANSNADELTANINTLKKQAEEKINSFVETDKLKDKILLDLHSANFWDDECFACINCGTCTYVCPTCWCFDIQDENYGDSGVRFKQWDSCMYPLFTLHGSGHNPRSTKVQRFRQRFMHKLKYYVDKYDNGIQCVGCGRCIRLCPVNIDIRKICNIMNSYEPAA